MTHTPPPHPYARGDRPIGHRTVGDVLRGVLAALVLTVLVAGLPVVLVVVSPAGFVTGLPGWDDLVGALTRPDDGHLFLDALALIGWIGWASFAASVITEIVSAARGLPAPHLPMLSLTQTAAAALIATAAVLVSSTPSGLTAPARAGTLSAPVATGDAPPAAATEAEHTTGGWSPSGRPEHQAESAPRHPTITVRRGDTLWGLAAIHLGDGARWREIYDLNTGAAQPAGGQLTEARWILPGWRLRMPADATGVPSHVTSDSDQHATNPPPSPPVHVVQPGDTLWDIAAAHLGDGARYREIYDHNEGHPQPDGQALHDPDQINPGWKLVLPEPSHSTIATHPLTSGDRPRLTRPTDSPTGDPGSTDSVTPPTPGRSAAARDDHRDGALSGAQDTVPTPHADDGWDSAATEVGLLIAGLTVLAAAGAVGEIARRRRRQQRVRRPGERVRMPEYDTTDEQLERALRAAPQPITLTALKQALRSLAIGCGKRQRSLPRLAAVLVSLDRVELLLAEDDAEPVAPFTAVTDRMWAAPVDEAPVNDTPTELTDDDVPDPYPALVSLGVTDDAVVLINLEAAGTLTITGEDDQSRAVLRALVCELATSELSAACSVTLGADFAELAEVCDRTRVNVVTDATGLSARITAHGQAISAVLDAASVTDVHEARSRAVAEDVWTPEIVASATPVGAPAAWSGVTALTCGESAGPGWTLQLRPGHQARLEPLAIDLHQSTLDSDTYVELLGLLRCADEPPARPASSDDAPDGSGNRAVDRPPGDDEAAAILANLPTVPDGPPRIDHGDTPAGSAPRMLVLGQLVVHGADTSMGAARRGRATELVAYLALYPGASGHQIDEVMWPGQRVTRQNRNAFVSRVRHWLGETPAAQPYLAHVNDAGDYRLRHDVTCDWHDFLRLARAGLERGENGARDLQAALSLVRGRPFLGIDPAAYTWAEADTQQMISAIVDVAHTLANIRLKEGDARAAQASAAKGLLVEPASEVLYRDAMRAALLRGDTPEVRRLRSQLLISLAAIDPDAGLEAETIELIAQRPSFAT